MHLRCLSPKEPVLQCLSSVNLKVKYLSVWNFDIQIIISIIVFDHDNDDDDGDDDDDDDDNDDD